MPWINLTFFYKVVDYLDWIYLWIKNSVVATIIYVYTCCFCAVCMFFYCLDFLVGFDSSCLCVTVCICRFRCAHVRWQHQEELFWRVEKQRQKPESQLRPSAQRPLWQSHSGADGRGSTYTHKHTLHTTTHAHTCTPCTPCPYTHILGWLSVISCK